MPKKSGKSKTPAGVDVNLLVALEALMDNANVTRAAAHIHKSQPALSNALSRLRHLFNDQILERDGAAMRLSPRARQLQPRVKAAMDAIRAVLSDVDEFVPAGAKLKVRACITDHATFRLVPALSQRLKSKGVELDLVLNWPRSKPDALKRLGDGAYDVVFGAYIENRAGLLRTPLYQERTVCLMRADHPAAAMRATVENLGQHVVLNTAYTGAAGRQVTAALENLGLNLRPIDSTPQFILTPFFLLRDDTIALTAEREAAWLASIMPLRMTPALFDVPAFPVEMITDASRSDEGWLRWLRAEIFDMIAEPPFRDLAAIGPANEPA